MRYNPPKGSFRLLRLGETIRPTDYRLDQFVHAAGVWHGWYPVLRSVPYPGTPVNDYLADSLIYRLTEHDQGD